MRRDLAGRRIIITGASAGIGRCLAEQCVLAGSRVALAARSGDKLEEACRSLEGKAGEAIPVICDVTDDADRRRLLMAVEDQWGGLDILINNAGVASWGHFSGSTEAIMRQVMEVNFFAPAELIRLAIPYLTRGQQPAIVNIASRCGRRGLPAWTEYSASKFALCGLTEALRGEMARFDIDVLLVVPGLTSSDLARNLLRNEGKMKIGFDEGMAPEFVATRILEALCKNRTETVIGAQTRWMLLVNRIFPGFVDRRLKKHVQRLYQQEGARAG
jgi:short-subunit dehydrogenase